MVSQHALQVVSQHALQQVSGGGIPACLAGLQAHTQGSLQAHTQGVSRPTPRGSPGPHLGVSPGTHPGGIPECTEADTPPGYCCGRYASYWNAFLLHIYFHYYCIFSGEPLKSDMFCVIFGVTGVVLFFIAQLRFADVSKWFERTYPNMNIYRIVYEDSVYLFVYLTLILLWRGCWNMNIRYCRGIMFVTCSLIYMRP